MFSAEGDDAFLCVDKAACEQRAKADPAPESETLDAWLEALRTRMDQHPQAEVAASPAARRDAVRVLTQASDDDPAQAEQLMKRIFEVDSSRDLSHGQCLVLVEEASNPNWKARAAALLEGVPA